MAFATEYLAFTAVSGLSIYTMKTVLSYTCATIACSFLLSLCGCVTEPGSVAGPKTGVTAEQIRSIRYGMTSADVIAILHDPVQRVVPTADQLDKMMPGDEWDNVWFYNCEVTPGSFLDERPQVIFHKDLVWRVWYPYLTKTDYQKVVDQVNGRQLTTSEQLEEIWGNPATTTSMVGGVTRSTYNLILPSGRYYKDAIIILYYGGNISSVAMTPLN